MPDMPTGALVRLYRVERRMSTVSLATHAGITARYLEMIEAGTKTPTLPVLRNLAKILGVRTSALVGEAPSEDHEGPVNPRLAEVERALYTYRSLALRDGDELLTWRNWANRYTLRRRRGAVRRTSTAMYCDCCPA